MTFAIRQAEASERGASHNRYRVGLHHLALKAKSRAAIDELHRFLMRENLPILDAPAEYPQYGPNYYAVFFADPDGTGWFPSPPVINANASGQVTAHIAKSRRIPIPGLVVMFSTLRMRRHIH